MGCLRTSQLSGVHCELLDVEKGCSEMEDDHRPSRRETGYQGHELSGLNGAVIREWENLHRSILHPDGVESILKVLDAKVGWIQEDESKLLLRKALSGWKEARTSLFDSARHEG